MKPFVKELHIRLYTKKLLLNGQSVALHADQAHYLGQVMRQKVGGRIALFNGKDGEWSSEIVELSKKSASLVPKKQLRRQRAEPDVWLLFAPLKHQKNERLIAQATELGVSQILPVKMQHGIVDKVNVARWQAAAMEAAEQSERLSVPEVMELSSLASALAGWDKDRLLILADETGGGGMASDLKENAQQSYAVLIGPEGGFSEQELLLLRGHEFVRGVSLGPRILKADTAIATILSLVMQQFGDWYLKPDFRSKA